jgi:hypothetical protein
MMSLDHACSVCGRSILPGEQTRGYLDGEGERRTVCQLCRERAARLGWIWEEEVDEGGALDPSRGRGGLLARLRRRRGHRPERAAEVPLDPEVGDEPSEPLPEAGSPAPAAEEQPPGRQIDEEDAGPDKTPEPAPRRSPDPAAPGAQVGRVQPETMASPRERFERALVRFNVSDESRMVAGLMRTLGEPLVSVGASAGSPHEVRVTVAWELSWYQWGVDLSDELRPVFQLDKGMEIHQLDPPARQWNARALGGGQVELGLGAGGRRPDGEPVGLDG